MLLECQNLTLGYGANVVAENISFTVNTGDYVCVIGENGAGKSTLIKTLLSLQAALSGKVLTSSDFARTQIGYLPQRTEAQKDFPATVQEIVLSGCLCRMGARPFYSQKEKQLAKQNIELLGITQLTKKSFRELSGGQQQRVLLARALCATEKLLILDEPTSGLDINATKELYGIIRDLNKKGIAIITVSHDIENCMKDASHVLHLSHKKYFYGTVAEYVASGFSFSKILEADK